MSIVAGELLPVKDVAERVLHISESSVKRLISNGDLRAVKVLGSTRIHTTDLNEYLERVRGCDLPPSAA